jgi:hypothetical protein
LSKAKGWITANTRIRCPDEAAGGCRGIKREISELKWVKMAVDATVIVFGADVAMSLNTSEHVMIRGLIEQARNDGSLCPGECWEVHLAANGDCHPMGPRSLETFMRDWWDMPGAEAIDCQSRGALPHVRWLAVVHEDGVAFVPLDRTSEFVDADLHSGNQWKPSTAHSADGSSNVAGGMMQTRDPHDARNIIRVCLDCARMAVGILERHEAERSPESESTNWKRETNTLFHAQRGKMAGMNGGFSTDRERRFHKALVAFTWIAGTTTFAFGMWRWFTVGDKASWSLIVTGASLPFLHNLYEWSGIKIGWSIATLYDMFRRRP